MNPAFIKKIIAIRGDIGKKWLESLPDQIQQYEKLWNITCCVPFPLSYNHVAPAKTKDGKEVVLKILLPVSEPSFESQALEFFHGNGVIKLLQKNTEKNVLLLENMQPGTSLTESPFTEQVTIFCEVATKIHNMSSNNIPVSFPTLSEWAKDFFIYRKMFAVSSGPIPKILFEKAEKIFTKYATDEEDRVLLHGDLHSANILLSSRGYVAIDPKGIVGDRAFEAGIFFRNISERLLHKKEYENTMQKLIQECSLKMHIDENRIKEWAFACAVNGLVWFLEDEKRFADLYLENSIALNSLLS